MFEIWHYKVKKCKRRMNNCDMCEMTCKKQDFNEFGGNSVG